MSNFNLFDYKTTDSKNYTHQSLNGGKFNISMDKRENLFNYLMKHPESALCEKLPEKFPLYFDIDGLSKDINIKDIKNIINKYLLEVCEKVDLENIITYNKSNLNTDSKANKYHLYYPGIIVNKQIAKKIVKYMNKRCKEDNTTEYFDEAAYNTCFRMFGVWKKKDKPGTDYEYLEDEGLTKLQKFKIVSLIGYNNNELTTFNSKISVKEQNLDDNKEDDEDLEQGLNQKKFEYKLLSKDDWYMGLKMLYCIKHKHLKQRDLWIKLMYVLRYIGFHLKDVMKWCEQYEGHDSNRINQIKAIMRSDIDYEKINSLGREKYFFKLVFNGYAGKVEKLDYGLDLITYSSLNVHKIDWNSYYQDIQFDRFNRIDREIIKDLLKDKVIINIQSSRVLDTYYWNGDLWINKYQTNKMNMIIKNLLENINMEAYKELNFNKDNYDPDTYQRICSALDEKAKWTTYQQNINEMARIINDYFGKPISFDKFNCKDFLLPVSNGNINLKTGKIQRRKYNDYFTYKIDINYDELINTDDIDDFMLDLMGGDEELKHYFHKCLGYCLSGSIDEQLLFILYGSGSNGKSVITKNIRELLNSISCTLNATTLTGDVAKGAATTNLNNIEHKRMAIIEEGSKDKSLNEAEVKKLTGTRKFPIRKMYCEEEEITMRAKIILCTNEIPKFDKTYALTRRLILIPFLNTYMDKKRYSEEKENNPNARLRKTEKEIEDILNREVLLKWLIEGSVLYYKEGLYNKPQKALACKEQIVNNADRIGKFFRNNIILLDEDDEDYDGIEFEVLYKKFTEHYGIFRRKYSMDDMITEITKRKLIPGIEKMGNVLPIRFR
jgi:P4 family phage/plasmid primase-like protien